MNDAGILSARVAKINADYEDCADFASVKAQQFVGEHAEPMTDAKKRAAINQAAAAVERTFLAWHESGCMTGAADYTRARNTWAEMLMKWGRVA